jgi:predicted acylesterase/phospholipase RssA
MKTALALAGGGTSGYISVSILEKIHGELKFNCNHDFELITGVSTGAIIGGLLSVGFEPKEIKKFYKRFYKDVFGEPKKYLNLLFGSFYDNQKLYETLIDIVGEVRIKDLPNNFMTYALGLDEPSLEAHFWKSWSEKTNVTLAEVMTASSCAPYVFSPFVIDKAHYYDGGIVFNEPSMPVVAELHAIEKSKEVKVLSIQTDFNNGYKNPKSIKGLFSLVSKIFELCVDSTERSSEYMAKQIHKDMYMNVNPKCYFPITSDDWSEMDKFVESTWDREKENLKKFLEM